MLVGLFQCRHHGRLLRARRPGDRILRHAQLRHEGPHLDIDLAPVAERQSPFSVRATLSLLESGGRPVIRSIERIYWPAPLLVGVRPLFQGDYAREGSQAAFEVVRASRDGKLHGASLPARLFRENRDYYWRFDDQRGWHSGFTETDELVATRSVSVPAGGRGKLEVPVKYGRYRLEIADPETGKTLKYRFYAGWSARNDEDQGIRPDRVALKLDKPAYRDGDTAKLTITPPHGGQALISVEADRTLWTQRIAMPDGGTTVDIPLDKAWRRHDLYVSVMVLRPGSAGEKVTPARARNSRNCLISCLGHVELLCGWCMKNSKRFNTMRKRAPCADSIVAPRCDSSDSTSRQ